jgi:hypothetical protein
MNGIIIGLNRPADLKHEGLLALIDDEDGIGRGDETEHDDANSDHS